MFEFLLSKVRVLSTPVGYQEAWAPGFSQFGFGPNSYKWYDYAILQTFQQSGNREGVLVFQIWCAGGNSVGYKNENGTYTGNTPDCIIFTT